MMAKSVVPSVSLILILFSVSATLSQAEPLKVADAVLDITGLELQRSERYVIVPSFRPHNGPVSYLFNEGSIRCSGDVIQTNSQPGVPFVFYPADTNEEIIRLGAELTIGEPRLGFCRGVVYWKVEDLDGQAIVSFDLDYDGDQRATFKITETRGSYTLSQCNGDICRYVGSYVDANGIVHLALTDDPTLFDFAREDNSARAAIN